MKQIRKFLDSLGVLANSYDHKISYELVEPLNETNEPIVANGTLEDLEFLGDPVDFSLVFENNVITVHMLDDDGDDIEVIANHPKAVFGLLYL